MRYSRLDRIAVSRPLPGVGDLLCSIPAWRALRRAQPDARLVWVGLPGTRWFAERFAHYIDTMMEFPGFPGIPERHFELLRFRQFLDEAYGYDFSLAIQLHGSGGIGNLFAQFLGANQLAGTYQPGEICPNEETFIPHSEELHEVERCLRVVEHIGCPRDGVELEFPISDVDRAELHRLPEWESLQSQPYVVLHPGGVRMSRRWLPAHFAALGDALAACGLTVVLTRTETEREAVEQAEQSMQHKPVTLTGRTSLGAMAALLETSRLLVCNDTGISHLAAALGTPSVVVFLTSSRQRWAPVDPARHRAVGDGLPSDRMTSSPHDDAPGFAAEVSVGEALDEALDVMEKEAVGRT